MRRRTQRIKVPKPRTDSPASASESSEGVRDLHEAPDMAIHEADAEVRPGELQGGNSRHEMA